MKNKRTFDFTSSMGGVYLEPRGTHETNPFDEQDNIQFGVRVPLPPLTEIIKCRYCGTCAFDERGCCLSCGAPK